MTDRSYWSVGPVALALLAVVLGGCYEECEVPSAWCDGDTVMKCEQGTGDEGIDDYDYDDDDDEEGDSDSLLGEIIAVIILTIIEAVEEAGSTYEVAVEDCGEAGLICVEFENERGAQMAECRLI
jgi:hypothetical protein